MQHRQFWHHASKEEIPEIDDSAQIGCEASEIVVFPLGNRLPFADEDSARLQHLIHADEIVIQAPEVIDLMQVDKEMAAAFRFILDVEIGLAIQHQSTRHTEAADIHKVVDEAKKIRIVLQIVLKEGDHNAVFRDGG